MDSMFIDLPRQDNNYMQELLDTISSIEYRIDKSKALLVCTVEELLHYTDSGTIISIKEPCVISTWNRGYDFTVTGFKKRKSDNTIMMCGTYLDKEDEEFLSYIWGYDSVSKLSDVINRTFFKQNDWGAVVA